MMRPLDFSDQEWKQANEKLQSPGLNEETYNSAIMIQNQQTQSHITEPQFDGQTKSLKSDRYSNDKFKIQSHLCSELKHRCSVAYQETEPVQMKLKQKPKMISDILRKNRQSDKLMKRARKTSKENFKVQSNAYGMPIEQMDSRQAMLSISNSEVHIQRNNDLSNITNTYGGLDFGSFNQQEDISRSFNYKSRFGR